MKTSTQKMLRKIAAIIVVSNLAISATLCAPSQQSPTGTVSASSSQITSNSGAQLAAIKTNSTPKSSSSTSIPSSSNGNGQLSSAASITSGLPSFVNLHSASSVAPNSNVQDEMDTFDGKNPFSDDSLWQIPIHLTRDQNAAESGSDNMAKSASETSNANDDDDSDADEPSYPAPASLPQSSSSSPTVISASTDLKTAAGYHYPTHGHHGYGPPGHEGGHHDGSHHEAGHHGAGHYGGDHYGKYFQYASVPYPHAWDFGYRRGNPYHTIERYEHGKGPHFQTKVKWSDKHGGYGVHVWDYNHDDHHSHHYGGHHESHGPSHYGGHQAGHSHGHYGGH